MTCDLCGLSTVLPRPVERAGETLQACPTCAEQLEQLDAEEADA